ncbi:MAG TPA: acyl-ACP--UDP-N-acetylglucosamine O-acyltransferase [Phycisphaerales bacterium]|nr:acyl-ACP--UDP-N-acetylglucosamine O-acyltransferase [Phycisphaerales bacterium]
MKPPDLDSGMATVHPTAVLQGDIDLADDVEIGPYCVLTGPISLGAGVRLISHVNLQGPVRIGENTIVYPNASLGFEPQDYKFLPGSPTAGVVIGRDCLIREHVTVHAATNLEEPTRIGNHVFMMANSHAGHDASVQDDVILVNNVALAGHSQVHTKAILSAGAKVHQFARIGMMAMVSGGALATVDVMPYCMAVGRGSVVGLNLVGLRRSGMSADEINTIRRVYSKVLRHNPPRDELIQALAEHGKDSPAIQNMHDFVIGTKRTLAKFVRKDGLS